MPNGWRTIKSLVHKIRLHGRRGKGMAESFSREKLKKGAAERRCMRNPVWPSSCVTPAGTSNELDVQNEWEENTHTQSRKKVDQERTYDVFLSKILCDLVFVCLYLVPFPSETWFRGMSVGGSFRRV